MLENYRVPTAIDLAELLGTEPVCVKAAHAKVELASPEVAGVCGGNRHVLLLFMSYSQGDTFSKEVIERLKKVETSGGAEAAHHHSGLEDVSPPLQVYMSIPSEKFQVLFVPNDQDEEGFETLYSSMPWAAIPAKDARAERLRKKLKVPMRCMHGRVHSQ